MPPNSSFAKRTSECQTEVKPENGKACVSLEDYFNQRSEMRATQKSSSFLFAFRPTEHPSGIFTSADGEGRNRPQSAASPSIHHR